MMAARRPIKSIRRGESGIAEAADGDAGQVRKHFEACEQADAASRTERGLMPAPGRAHGTERPRLAFDLHRVVGKEGGVGEDAAAPGLTIEAGAGIDDSGRAPCGGAQCTAGAGSRSRVFTHARPQYRFKEKQAPSARLRCVARAPRSVNARAPRVATRGPL